MIFLNFVSNIASRRWCCSNPATPGHLTAGFAGETNSLILCMLPFHVLACYNYKWLRQLCGQWYKDVCMKHVFLLSGRTIQSVLPGACKEYISFGYRLLKHFSSDFFLRMITTALKIHKFVLYNKLLTNYIFLGFP